MLNVYSYLMNKFFMQMNLQLETINGLKSLININTVLYLVLYHVRCFFLITDHAYWENIMVLHNNIA